MELKYQLLRYTQITLAILIISQFGCKDKYQAPTSWVGQETIDFTLFKKNSWWLYKNVNNNFQDTWKIIEVNEKMLLASPKSQPANIQTYELKIATSYNDTFFYRIQNGSLYFYTKKNSGEVQEAYFDNGLKSLSVCDNNKLINVKSDSMSGIVVRKEFEMLPFPCTNIFPRQFVWERKIGLTKFSYQNGDTLILIDYNLK